MKFTTQGLIIKQQNIGEQDRLVWVLTKDSGVIRAFVRGAKNIKNPKSTATSLLCYSKLSVYKGKEAYSIDEAEVIELFFDLRKDIEKMSLAQYFCELANYICPQEQSAEHQLSLILNALYLLSTTDKNQSLIKACVELRLASLSGYMPDLVMCRDCGEYEAPQMMFLLTKGALKCSECFKKAPCEQAVPLDRGLLHALRHIVFSESKKVFSFNLSDEGLQKLNYITETYLAKVLERDFPTLHFYKTIKS